MPAPVSSMCHAAAAIELVARASYGKLMACLVSQTRDVTLAEELISGAFLRALETWPQRGVPDNPEAWLLTTARNLLIDDWRRAKRCDELQSDLLLVMEERMSARTAADFPDDRLKLLFCCAHPAIDSRLRAPLMLNVVLGLTVEDIAPAFVLPTKTLAQRLWRGKDKIRRAGIPFAEPAAGDLPQRLDAVLDAVYAAYSLEWDEPEHPCLHREANYLARLCVQLLPAEPEAKGLLAFILLSEARREARLDEDGSLVPLDRQDATRWDRSMIEEALMLLGEAGRHQAAGVYQVETAIQAQHGVRALGRDTDWRAIVSLYDVLLLLSPTIGNRVARAAALLMAVGPEAALSALDVLPAEPGIDAYQPYWATRAHAEARRGNTVAATAHFRRAIALTASPSASLYLERCLGEGSQGIADEPAFSW